MKAATSAADESSKAVGGLLVRLFGPAADVAGEALAQWTAKRVRNAQRIAEIADRKTVGRGGIANMRLVPALLGDGSYCDDELMAEYLGGVLAGGRTPSGRDDRAVSWSKLVTSMSVIQIRAHFILYREWAHALHGVTHISLASDINDAQMYVNLDEFLAPMHEAVPDLSDDSLLTDIVSGLGRFDLIGRGWAAGNAFTMQPTGGTPAELPFEQAFRVRPSIAGIALYGWACGVPDVDPTSFKELPELLALDVPIPRPAVYLPKLAEATSSE